MLGLFGRGNGLDLSEMVPHGLEILVKSSDQSFLSKTLFSLTGNNGVCCGCLPSGVLGCFVFLWV